MSSIVGWLLFLALCAAIGMVVLRLRASRGPTLAQGPLADPDDLDRLGLSAARPATPHPSEVAAERAGAPVRRRNTDPMLPPVATPRPVESPRPGGVRLSDDAPWHGRAVPLLLGSLSAHTRGHVAVVRHADGVFEVLARTDGGPLTPVRRAPLHLDGPEHLGASDLNGLSVLVGGAAWVAPMGHYTVLVGGEGKALDPYLSLLADLTPGVERSRPASPDDPAEVAEPAREADAPAEAGDPAPTPVPRAVLIGEEQDAAREAGRPLAFALITLADAEDRLTRDDPTEVAAAESALRLRLEAADGVRRVEPFGDLLFGAFLDHDPEGMAQWCTDLSAADPPLFIGAVAPADGEPSAVRDAAAQSLHRAYDRRGTSIVSA